MRQEVDSRDEAMHREIRARQADRQTDGRTNEHRPITKTTPTHSIACYKLYDGRIKC